jgi:hypothetical protein
MPTLHRLPPQLCDLYENDCIFDKFDCCVNGTGEFVASGSYNNKFRIFGCSNGVELSLDASRDPLRKRMQTPPKVGALTAWESIHVCCSCCCVLAGLFTGSELGWWLDCRAHR